MAVTLNAATTGGGGLIQSADSSGVMALQTAGTTAVTIDTSQNVGIGTSSPQAKLAVSNNGADGLEILTGTSGQIGFQTYNRSTSAYIQQAYVGSYFTWTTGGVGERMRIDSSGNVMIGATSSSNKFTVVSNSSTVTPVYINDTATGTNSQFLQYFVRNNVNVGSIQTTGSATSYVTSSDYRLKENVQPMVGALDTIAQLKPVTYDWKLDGSKGQGFIAHELQAVVPDCVTGEKDAVDEEGNPIYQGIDTSFLVATLTAAIQEQQELIKQLQADVAALKGAK